MTEFSEAFRQRYELLRPLGEGGVAEVFLARQRELDRVCAVKAFTPGYFDDASARERFLDEGRLLAGVAHPNIVQVYDSGIDGDVPYLVLEYVEGRDLKQHLLDALQRTGEPLAPREVVTLAAGIARGLAAAHADGVVHRDLKPENVLLDGAGTPKVADFGFAKRRDFERSYVTLQGMILGTPYYIAPEAVNQKAITAKADLYALGVILFELLTGEVPFRGETDTATLLMHATAECPRPSSLCPSLPRRLDELVLWCAAKEPEERPRSAEQLARILTVASERYEDWVSRSSRLTPAPSGVSSRAALRAAVGAGPEPSRTVSTGTVLRRHRRRLVTVAALAALGGGAAAAWSWWTPSAPPTITAVATFEGLQVRWESRVAYAGRVSVRRVGASSWQDVSEGRAGTRHAVRVSDLPPGEYEVRLFYPGGEVPCPPVEVAPFRRSRPRLRVSEDRSAVELRTSLPVGSALTRGPSPGMEGYSALRTDHVLEVELAPEERWMEPALFLRDATGEVRQERLPFPVLGGRALARELLRVLEAEPVAMENFVDRVQARRGLLVESGRAEVDSLARAYRERNPAANERLARLEAEVEYVRGLDAPYDDLFQELPGHPLLEAFRPRAAAYFGDPGIPIQERLRLYRALLGLAPLDALVEAEGGAPPLGVLEVVGSVARLSRVPQEERDARRRAARARVAEGAGVSVFDEPVPARHTVLLEESRLLEEREGIFAFSRAVTRGIAGYDLTDLPKELVLPLALPEASRGRARRVAVEVYNLWPKELSEVLLEPAGGTGEALPLLLYNRQESFPGAVTHVLEPHDRTQRMEVEVAPWALPPGRYRVRVTGRMVPGAYRGTLYQIPRVVVTWGGGES